MQTVYKHQLFSIDKELESTENFDMLEEYEEDIEEEVEEEEQVKPETIE